MPQPLVLVIEPDIRQAAIVKRIVREKVLAEVTVVDSRDAALDAMRTMVPDVLLLSTLLSPRDEDELIAHLRTLQNAEHLQTHTIPQLASAIAPDEAKPKGLLSAFRRRKAPESTPAGCDPDLFAEEIRVYLERASEKKREMRTTAAIDPVARTATIARPAAPAVEHAEAGDAADSSSWSSPFEWRPASDREPAATVQEAVPARAAAAVVEAAALPEIAEPLPEPERIRSPLIMRTPRGWWFEDGTHPSAAAEPDSEMRAVLAALSVPATVAAVSYAEGCRIRRVRVSAP